MQQLGNGLSTLVAGTSIQVTLPGSSGYLTISCSYMLSRDLLIDDDSGILGEKFEFSFAAGVDHDLPVTSSGALPLRYRRDY